MSVNIITRLITLVEAGEINPTEEYILLQSPTLGMRRISVANLLGGV